MMMFGKSEFAGKLRQALWPIYPHELHKFALTSLLMFSILFNQNILRILKDSVLIPEISAEITSFAKVYCVTPCAAIFVVLYARLVNSFSFNQIFSYLTLFFVSFFLLFGLIIYPNVDAFHPDAASIDSLVKAYPHFKWYILLVGHWSSVLFYVLCELWPNIFYVLLFWQFTNDITTTNEAKRFYSFFSLFGNSSMIVVGLIMMYLASKNSILNRYFVGTEEKVVLVGTTIVLIALFACLSVYLVGALCKMHNASPRPKTQRPKLGVVESFRYILRSRYLWLLLICSASFGLTMNLVEVVWKDCMKKVYSSVNEYAEFNGMFVAWTGVVIMILTVVGGYILRSYSWLIAAMITPIIILSTGAIFFALVVFDEIFVDMLKSIIITSPVAIAIFVGTIQNVLAKGAKYSIWDTSREMLYIPLDSELKSKGKAAVDVISSKIGKSFAGIVQTVIFTIVPTATYSSISSILMSVFIIVCVAWICAVKEISREYENLVRQY